MTEPLISALPPVGLAMTSPHVRHFISWVAWLKTICSDSQLRHFTLRNLEEGLGIRFSHSAILLQLRLLEPYSLAHQAVLALLALEL